MVIGTGKAGAKLQLQALHEVAIAFIYEREPRDVEKEIIKKIVDEETADWPEGAYMIDDKNAHITYNGVSIFEYMKAIRS